MSERRSTSGRRSGCVAARHYRDQVAGGVAEEGGAVGTSIVRRADERNAGGDEVGVGRVGVLAPEDQVELGWSRSKVEAVLGLAGCAGGDTDPKRSQRELDMSGRTFRWCAEDLDEAEVSCVERDAGLHLVGEQVDQRVREGHAAKLVAVP